jgi:hypothetical protein
MALYRHHCGQVGTSNRETVWRFIGTTADTNKAIALDKRGTMA